MKVNLSAIAGADLPVGADSIDLNLFADTSLTAVKKRFERRGARHFTWEGKVPDDPLSMVVLVAGDGQMQGAVFAHGKHYAVKGGDTNTQEVVEIDQSAFPREACDQAPTGDQNPAQLAPGTAPDAAAEIGSVIDVLVVYTPAARAANGGTTAMQNLAQLAVDTTNSTYGNSSITPRLALVHTAEIAYTETGDWDLDLSRLSGTSDGYMDSVHTLRDTYRADVVVLLIDNHTYCGMAYLIATATTAFALVDWSCVSGNYTFGHEIGHLQGARHDMYVDPTLGSPSDYNHGHVDTASRQRTVMAYPDKCSDLEFSCTRIPYWSNPDKVYPSTSTPTGSVDLENNTRQLNDSALTVVNFKQGTRTLTIQSAYPAVGVTISVSPADNNALGDGSTIFTRTYDSGTAVTLTAPLTTDSNPFSKWSGCTSTSGTSGSICSVTMDSAKTVTANYLNPNPENMVVSGSNLYVDFGADGIWKWNGAALSQLTGSDPENMVASGSTLYADFGSLGIWMWNGSAWSQLAGANPENMVASGSTLYADFGSFGIWMWNGSAWSQLAGANPENMVASGSTLYADFGAYGIWVWNGATWSQPTASNPENMVVSGSTLYGDFGTSGIWVWNGAAWSQPTASNPENMVVSGSTLYGDFGSSGIWVWNGTAWSHPPEPTP